MKAFYFIFITASILSLFFGVKNYFDEKAIFAAYEPATAAVTDWVPDPHYGSADMCPVYEYTTKEGDTRSYTGQDCVSKPDPGTIGKQQQQIYYDPKNPYSDIETKGWFGTEGSGLIFGFIGFAFFSLFWMIPLFYNLFRKRAALANVNRAQPRHG